MAVFSAMAKPAFLNVANRGEIWCFLFCISLTCLVVLETGMQLGWLVVVLLSVSIGVVQVLEKVY